MDEPETTYDVCILGAGISGLNAAFVASEYLPRTGRILLLDRHQGPGGMWNDTYSYVRLHQPHPVFTAGNIPWTLGREPGYLPTRDEVLAHLRHCYDEIASRIDLDPRWGWSFESREEDATGVTIVARDPEGARHRFRADRFIHAVGFDVEVNDPLPLTSQQVRSVAPEQLEQLEGDGPLGAGGDAAVWIIGSGKTAVDTAHAVITRQPGRTVGMVTGSGTYFFNRDRMYVEGARRWWGGTRPNLLFTRIANRFDGTNVDEIAAMCRDGYGVTPLASAGNNAFGILSVAEADVVRAGLSHVVSDHLVDVVDDDDGPVMVLRSGERRRVAPGSWVVNCTGYLNPREVDHEPYASPGGRVLSINSSSMTLGFSSVAGYYMTHLLFLEQLADAPLYELDFHASRTRTPSAAPPVVSALILHNLSVIAERVPAKVLQDCGLDFDRWYPAPRRLAGQLRFLATHKRDRARYRAALDTYSASTGVRCGPLAPAPAVP